MVGGMPQAAAPSNVPPNGFGSPGAGRSAADLIRNLLTTPRPGGLAGVRGAQGVTQAQPVFAEGIAGVASKVEQRGVKVYNEREQYNEWEFVYDYRQDASMAGAMGGAGQAGNINPSQPGLGTGGSLQIDPSQGVPVPAVAGFPGVGQPGQPVAGQPTDGANPYAQPAGVPAASGYVSVDPASGAYPQPVATPPAGPPQQQFAATGFAAASAGAAHLSDRNPESAVPGSAGPRAGPVSALRGAEPADGRHAGPQPEHDAPGRHATAALVRRDHRIADAAVVPCRACTAGPDAFPAPLLFPLGPCPGSRRRRPISARPPGLEKRQPCSRRLKTVGAESDFCRWFAVGPKRRTVASAHRGGLTCIVWAGRSPDPQTAQATGFTRGAGLVSSARRSFRRRPD